MTIESNTIMMSKMMNYPREECNKMVDDLYKELHDYNSSTVYARLYTQKL